MKNIIIENPRLYMEIAIENGVFIKHCRCQDIDSSPNYQEDGELFCLRHQDTIMHSGIFHYVEHSIVKDNTQELLTISLEHPTLGLRIRLCLLNNLIDTISIIFQFADFSEDASSHKNYFFHSPFLANVRLSDETTCKMYFPAKPAEKQNGETAVQPHPLIQLPLVLTDEADHLGLAVFFPSLSIPSLASAVQNRNVDLRTISSANDLKNHALHLRLNHILTDVAEFSICGLKNGWREAFSRARDAFRETLDLREYEKEDLQWFRKAALHHFAFLYSKEAYNYETNKPDIAKLAADGLTFGGFDTITLWHQYPRLGVDARNQWDFFRDYPGSVEGLADTINGAHDLGIKVLLPYKPWDVQDSQSMLQTTEEIIDLLRETDADGFFLDTMNQAPQSFRRIIDTVKPSTVFCSELHPTTAPALSLLTASWDQYWSAGIMPEVDLLRFMLPEHAAPQIARWQYGENKDFTINRAIFSGTGIVIWQDVFGSWLPYSEQQKEKIRQYKQLWIKYYSYFQGLTSIPLYPVKQKNLYCNLFSSEKLDGVIFALYNDSDTEISGLLLDTHTEFQNGTCIWGRGTVSLRKNHLYGSIPTRDVVMFHLY